MKSLLPQITLVFADNQMVYICVCLRGLQKTLKQVFPEQAQLLTSGRAEKQV